jgi:Flp pilus assembly pilin Flp
MHSVVVLVNRLVGRKEGQDLIEYALLVGLISLIALAGVTAIGNTVNQVFWQGIANALAV